MMKLVIALTGLLLIVSVESAFACPAGYQACGNSSCCPVLQTSTDSTL